MPSNGTFSWDGGGVILRFSYGDDRPVCLAGYAAATGTDVTFENPAPIVEIMTSEGSHWLACSKLTHTEIGRSLRYAGRCEQCPPSAVNDAVASRAAGRARRLCIDLAAPGSALRVQVVYEAVPDTSMVRTYAVVRNDDAVGTVAFESVTSLAVGLGHPTAQPASRAYFEGWSLVEADMEWLAEGRWHASDMRAIFPRLTEGIMGCDPRGSHQVVSHGTWSTGRFAPLFMLTHRESGQTMVAQVEHNGAWRWEVGENAVDGYAALSGPTEVDHGWHVVLHPGEEFTTVPASFVVASSPADAVEELTAYRRAWRVEHPANAQPAVVFNDYMNTIYGDPTTDKLLPLVEAAGRVGAQVFVIDCGWYDDTGDWWPSVGEWQPSATRFPGGLGEVVDAIRAHGMVPGLWIEPEVIGVDSPMAARLPDSAFIQRNGKRVTEQQRYMLDFRSPDARAHLDGVVDRLVGDYGIGYFKFDYNVTPGTGSDVGADSTGESLLECNRAYGAWIESLYRRHPGLIIENCSSGGMREDFAQTSRVQVQSTSDQEDWRFYPPIAANAPMLMLPEQAANWAYPDDSMDDDQTVFTMVTSMLGRLFVSGYVNRMEPGQRELVAEAIGAYRRYVQPRIGSMVPFWPMGLAGWTDGVLAYGLRPRRAAGEWEDSLVSVWVRGDGAAADGVALSLPQLAGHDVCVEQVYPAASRGVWEASWDGDGGMLRVMPPRGGFQGVVLRVGAPRE